MPTQTKTRAQQYDGYGISRHRKDAESYDGPIRQARNKGSCKQRSNASRPKQTLSKTEPPSFYVSQVLARNAAGGISAGGCRVHFSAPRPAISIVLDSESTGSRVRGADARACDMGCKQGMGWAVTAISASLPLNCWRGMLNAATLGGLYENEDRRVQRCIGVSHAASELAPYAAPSIADGADRWIWHAEPGGSLLTAAAGVNVGKEVVAMGHKMIHFGLLLTIRYGFAQCKPHPYASDQFKPEVVRAL